MNHDLLSNVCLLDARNGMMVNSDKQFAMSITLNYNSALKLKFSKILKLQNIVESATTLDAEQANHKKKLQRNCLLFIELACK